MDNFISFTFLYWGYSVKISLLTLFLQYRVWSRPGAVEAQAYALDQGVRMTTYFEEYFDYAFPLEKQGEK